jgi:NADH-ubiquinone oxidoreductase chain 2
MLFLSILILIVAKALPSLNTQLSSIYITRISAIIFIFAGVLSFNSLYIQSIGSGIGIYSGLFHITQISHLIEIFLFIIGSIILIAWPLINIDNNNNKNNKFNNNNNNIKYSSDYSLIVLFSTLGSSLILSSSDLVSMYLSIELQSFGLYILACLYRESESSTSAGLKYFLLGGLSSCLILLGAGLIYAFTGLTQFESIYSILSISEFNYIIQGLSFGLILIIFGLLFKIAAAPLHNWAPDVYNDTPTIVTIWLTIIPKISILILLLEIYSKTGYLGGLNFFSINNHGYAEFLDVIFLKNNITYLLENYNLDIISLILNIENNLNIYLVKNLLLISSLLSLIIGTIVGLAQNKIKRLLAYSTISHIGFILLALAVNTEQSIDSLLFYIIQYSITNLNIFLILIAFSYVIKHSNQYNNNNLYYIKYSNLKSPNKIIDINYISELKNQFLLNPLLSLSLSICLFSMAGIPPLIGFFSKQFVLYSAIQNGYYFISLIAILVSVISASYYLKIIKVIHSESDTESEDSLLVDKNNLFFKNIKNTTFNFNKFFNKNDIYLTNFHSFLISTLTLSILLFIFKPSLILNSTQLLSLSLFNF